MIQLYAFIRFILTPDLQVIGQGKSGKTSTVRSLLREPFNPKWDSTIGVALTQVETSSAVSWKKVEGMDSDFALEFAARVAAERLAKSTELKTGLGATRKGRSLLRHHMHL